MSLTISFELSEKDLEHFRAMAREAQQSVKTTSLNSEQIVSAARELFDSSKGPDQLPEFIAERLKKLEILVQMVDDDEWNLPEQELDRVLSAMAYFADPEDLIPDRIPGIGFLDDAIMAELVTTDLEEEIKAYSEFASFRTAEEERRETQGIDTHVGREEWLADKRAVLHHRMRQRRRNLSASGGAGRIRLW